MIIVAFPSHDVSLDPSNLHQNTEGSFCNKVYLAAHAQNDALLSKGHLHVSSTIGFMLG